MLSSSSSSARLAPLEADAAATRPRNRRLISGGNQAATATSTSTSLRSSASASPARSRGVSPLPAPHIGLGSGSGGASGNGVSKTAGQGGNGSLGIGLLDGSWRTPSWASIQGFAASLLAGGGSDAYASDTERAATGRRSGIPNVEPLRRSRSGSSRKPPEAWGPAPPNSSKNKTRPRLQQDAAASASLAERDAALRARKTASVLESYPGVNGGLDVAGRFKRRTSDEDLSMAAAGGAGGQQDAVDEHLVYIHHVQPNDTYAGVVLKYRCREDAFRRANGLWSRDNIQIRKWLALPVDACEVKGRPCEPPSYYSDMRVDLLAPTPQPSRHSSQDVDDFFSAANGPSPSPEAPMSPGGGRQKEELEERPWTHVRWVSLDSCAQPVEIARVPRRALGYFPPRRKKSLHTVSTLSTPRQSLDVPSVALSDAAAESPGSPASSSRRYSTLAGRTTQQQLQAGGGGSYFGPSTPGSSARSRVGSISGTAAGGDEARPVWMRRPGGVGTLSKRVRAPGPEGDYFNTWTRRHLPGLNIDSLPSMSVMGSERARFGFDADAAAGIVESAPFEEGHDVSSAAKGGVGAGPSSGSGLDKAAAAIETWLRGAFARRPSTPTGGAGGMGPGAGSRYGSRQLQPEEMFGDLIELEDTNGDDVLPPATNAGTAGASGRSDGEGALGLRGRGSAASAGLPAASKGKKAD